MKAEVREREAKKEQAAAAECASAVEESGGALETSVLLAESDDEEAEEDIFTVSGAAEAAAAAAEQARKSVEAAAASSIAEGAGGDGVDGEEPGEVDDEWIQARELLKDQLDADEEVTLVFTASAPMTVGELAWEEVGLDEPQKRPVATRDFGGVMPWGSWESGTKTPEERPGVIRGACVNLNLFRSHCNLVCRRSMLQGTRVMDDFAAAMMAKEPSSPKSRRGKEPNRAEVYNSSRKVVVELDGGCVRADVGAVARSASSLLTGEMPGIEDDWGVCCATLLAGHVLGDRSAVAKCVQRISRSLTVPTICQVFICLCKQYTEVVRFLESVLQVINMIAI